MSARGALLSVAVVGATGCVGSELLEVLESRAFPVSRLVPVATDRSLGAEVEFAGEIHPVQSELDGLDGVDLIFLCAPEEVSLDVARRALTARVPCVDCSGAMLHQPDVALVVADRLGPEEELDQPLVASPGGPALAWSVVLAPLDEAAGLRRVIATSLEAASVAGRAGIEALSGQSIALFNQGELPEFEDGPVAFDCLPAIGAADADGATRHEARIATTLQRVLGRELPLAVTALRVPTFSGDGASLVVETERPLSPDEARALLAKTPGVLVWPDAGGPSTRTTASRDEVLVGRVRVDPSRENALQLWIAADGLRLTALNAVKLAEARPLTR